MVKACLPRILEVIISGVDKSLRVSCPGGFHKDGRGALNTKASPLDVIRILLIHYLGRIALSLCWGLWLPYLIPFTSQGQDESIALPPREEMAPIESIEGINQIEREERISFILLQSHLRTLLRQNQDWQGASCLAY